MDDPVVVASEDSLDRARWTSVKMLRDQAAAALTGSAMDTAAESASGGNHTSRKVARRGFVLCTQKDAPKAITPRAEDLRPGLPLAVPPPPAVAENLAGAELLIGIDVETHDLISGNTNWRPGQFGFLTKVTDDTLNTLRIVQLGWVVGKVDDSAPSVKQRFVRPAQFDITSAATGLHGITQDRALTGRPLREVLEEMMADVMDASARGEVQICAHHLEFDGGVIAAELERAGLHDLRRAWKEAVARGFCSMQPCVASWVRSMLGADEIPYNVPIKLRDLVAGMLPDHRGALANHHDAGNDAYLHWLIGGELAKRAKARGS